MKNLNQTVILFLLVLLTISCNNDDTSNSSNTPNPKGKWAFGEDYGCGKNSIEFKNTNVFIEHHYNANCSSTPYYGEYTLVGDIVTINGTEKIIIELTNTILILYNPINDITSTYERMN